MGAAEKIFEKNVALVQPHVPEPIRAVALFERKGSFGSKGWGAVGARGAMLDQWATSIQRAADFPPQSFLAVTDTTLYAFKAKGGLKWKIQEQLGAWPFGTFHAETGDGKVTKFVKLDFGDGSTVELETMTTMANALNVKVVDALAALPPPADWTPGEA